MPGAEPLCGKCRKPVKQKVFDFCDGCRNRFCLSCRETFCPICRGRLRKVGGGASRAPARASGGASILWTLVKLTLTAAAAAAAWRWFSPDSFPR